MIINIFKWFKSEKVDSKKEEKELILRRLKRGGENMLKWKWFENEDGTSAVEYALLVALIAGVIVGAVTLFGGQVKAIFDTVKDIGSLPH
jgi:Flp pilus assembly pilin Flp